MRAREKYENALLSIKFTGHRLTGRGVSIYDLGATLIAIQRIVHKAYLARDERLSKGAFPTKDERQLLALQLGERKRGSDAFALVAVLADPTIRASLQILIKYITDGIIGYYVQDVLQRLAAQKNPNTQIFIGSIHAEIVNMVHRIDAAGGVEAISIGSPALNRPTIATFDGDSKDYINRLSNEKYEGQYQRITGQVYKFYPRVKIVTIRQPNRTTVNVHLKSADFDSIRYHQEANPRVTIWGKPIYKLGVETKSITQFRATRIEFAEEDENDIEG